MTELYEATLSSGNEVRIAVTAPDDREPGNVGAHVQFSRAVEQGDNEEVAELLRRICHEEFQRAVTECVPLWFGNPVTAVLQ